MATRIRLITLLHGRDDRSAAPASRPPDEQRASDDFDNTLGTVVAFDVEGLQISYDLADGVYNWSNVRMTDADLAGTGRCPPLVCSPNQIRKVNIALTGRSRQRLRATAQFAHKTLVTQVSLRSLAFVDRYR